MLSLFIKTAKAIPEWRLLLGSGIIFLIVAGISFICHMITPEEKRSVEEPSPYQIIFFISVGIILASIIFYIF